MSRAERADKLHDKGYNCCQAVACVFADEVGMDEATLYKVAEGFGGGMGTELGVCGAVSGAAIVAGMINSDGNIDAPGQTKKISTKASGTIQQKFTEKAQRLICGEIKRGNNGAPFISCSDCIKTAVELTEEVLGL